MEHEPPRPVQDAARRLLEICLHAAEESEDAHRALTTLNAWIARELEKTRPRSRGRAAHGVLTPQGRAAGGRAGRSGEGGPDGAEGDGGGSGRITDPLAVVVIRARWKAAACRLALDKRELAKSEGGPGEDALQQIAARERSLRSRLQGLPDTSAWMLDLPFGTRVSESDAFDVGDEQVERLGHVADCYETLALGAETAMELDESGAFRKKPVSSFLYLLAEAQSALLHSLREAPTRNDSDQRSVFLWLKDQTTHHQIYVDRHMRLDDPADITGSKDLADRIRRSAREIGEARKARRERGQILNKIRYHVGKLTEPGGLRVIEIESLAGALERWVAAGNASSDRAVVEVLKTVREHVDSMDDLDAEAVERVRDVFDEHMGEQASAEQRASDEARVQELLDNVRELLDKRNATLVAAPGLQVDREQLAGELGAAGLEVVPVDVDGPEEARREALEPIVEAEGVDLILLGVRLAADEYQAFKQRCLDRRKPFVRLPGAITAAAIAHQISRQVSWRLREMRDEDSQVR